MRISNSQIKEDESENDLNNFEDVEIPDIDFDIPCEKIPVILEIINVFKFVPNFEDIDE